jgi:hypothetical protein
VEVVEVIEADGKEALGSGGCSCHESNAVDVVAA